MSEPPRPSVVTSNESPETPWKPATRTISSRSNASWIRRARTSTIFAFVCVESVTIPAWEPVSEIALCPRSTIAIATSAHEIRSPTDSSMSSSRGFGRDDTWCASDISSSVCCPIAETTPTTLFPDSCAATRRRATRFSFSVSPTEVPPNFMTTTPGVRGARSSVGTASYSVMAILRQCRHALRYRLRTHRDWVAPVFGAIGVALVPWTIWLSTSLPPRHLTHRWDVAWAGFDIGLAVCFVGTAVAAWRRSPWVGALAAATGTLLLADAWFDVVLESRGAETRTAIIEAVVAELPVAALCSGSPTGPSGS